MKEEIDWAIVNIEDVFTEKDIKEIKNWAKKNWLKLHIMSLTFFIKSLLRRLK